MIGFDAHGRPLVRLRWDLSSSPGTHEERSQRSPQKPPRGHPAKTSAPASAAEALVLDVTEEIPPKNDRQRNDWQQAARRLAAWERVLVLVRTADGGLWRCQTLLARLQRLQAGATSTAPPGDRRSARAQSLQRKIGRAWRHCLGQRVASSLLTLLTREPERLREAEAGSLPDLSRLRTLQRNAAQTAQRHPPTSIEARLSSLSLDILPWPAEEKRSPSAETQETGARRHKLLRTHLQRIERILVAERQLLGGWLALLAPVLARERQRLLAHAPFEACLSRGDSPHQLLQQALDGERRLMLTVHPWSLQQAVARLIDLDSAADGLESHLSQQTERLPTRAHHP